MGIKTELSNDEFVTVYGNSQYVRGFSYEAKIALLDHISELQDEVEDPTSIDWTGIFMEAGEHDDADLVNMYEDSLENYAEEVIDMARNLELDDELELRLENEAEVSDEELLTDNLVELLTLSEFVEGAARIIGENESIIKLDSGGWLKVTA